MKPSHFRSILVCLIACAPEVFALSSASSADILEKTIGEIEQLPLSMIFVEKIVQYPNVQEHVLSANSDAMERLRSNPKLVDIRTEIDKVLIAGQRYSLHQVITHGDQFKITLNQQQIYDGKNLKSVLFGNKDSVFRDLAEKMMPVKLRDNKDISDQAVKKYKVYDPAQLLQRYSLMGSGSATMSDFRKQLMSAKNIDGELVFEFDNKVSTINLSSEGLPEVITMLDGDAKTKNIIEIKYIRLNLSKDSYISFPQEISSTKQILINNQYVTYIDTVRQFRSIKVLDAENLRNRFETMNPVCFEKSDITALSDLLEQK